ncbi:murein biosynthesis integral membrane protein MurJ [Streptomyces sp. 6N223]|uniref:murein biosynthesis integral membrane protein MurJ n=1 Tax=Streptomyces sp. 6N223 TaxID=3457412 RepID=UPI003FD1AB61
MTAILTAGGAVCGLARDQLLARLFGADGDTDAFLVAWTIPEVASTLLIEDAMALVLVPAFSLALAGGQAEVRRLAAATFPRLLLALAVGAAALAAAADPLVRALAPGLADPALAVDCTRLTAVTVLTFGVAGYLSALLRAHRSFMPPAAIYIAYNAGIIALALALGETWGIRAAAAGVAAGGLLMVLLQLPFALRKLRAEPDWRGPWRPWLRIPLPQTRTPADDAPRPPGGAGPGDGAIAPPRCRVNGGCGEGSEGSVGAEHAERGGDATAADGVGGRARLPAAAAGRPPVPGVASTSAGERGERGESGERGVRSGRGQEGAAPPRASVAVTGLAVVAPVACFALLRQSQVLVERFLGSSLSPGVISYLNFAQKVAQIPMVLSMMICTVTLPIVARALAEGDTERARQRVERDLTLAAAVVLAGAAYVVACAPHIIEVLFQRGEFGADATAATAGVMRVYALGLLGHTLVGTLVRPFFSGACAAHRPTWFPMAAMGGGLALTAVAGLVAVRLAGWGAPGIAAANAAGISLTAYLLLRGLRARVVPVGLRAVLPRLACLVLAAGLATASGWYAAGLPGPGSPVAACVLGAVAVPAVFAAVLAAVAARQRLLPERPQTGSEIPTHDDDHVEDDRVEDRVEDHIDDDADDDIADDIEDDDIDDVGRARA